MEKYLEQGFTLIELLVSIVIISLLATFVSEMMISSKRIEVISQTRENAYSHLNGKLTELQAKPGVVTDETCETTENYHLCWKIEENVLSFGALLEAVVTVDWTENETTKTISLTGAISSL